MVEMLGAGVADWNWRFPTISAGPVSRETYPPRSTAGGTVFMQLLEETIQIRFSPGGEMPASMALRAFGAARV